MTPNEIEKRKRQLEEKNTQIQTLRQELKHKSKHANSKVLEMSMADYDKQLEQLNDGDDEYTQNIIDNEYEDKLKRLEQHGDDEYTQNIIDNEYEDKLKRLEQRMQQMEKSQENKINKR
ncbi:hypothetical protein QE152_g22126 [Popillia japonica]|uniref:Uncharacterized protein n=1 Tax=Popillia japonica TaxID=7064 RepID=A0AAW1KLY3_POPJA